MAPALRLVDEDNAWLLATDRQSMPALSIALSILLPVVLVASVLLAIMTCACCKGEDSSEKRRLEEYKRKIGRSQHEHRSGKPKSGDKPAAGLVVDEHKKGKSPEKDRRGKEGKEGKEAKKDVDVGKREESPTEKGRPRVTWASKSRLIFLAGKQAEPKAQPAEAPDQSIRDKKTTIPIPVITDRKPAFKATTTSVGSSQRTGRSGFSPPPLAPVASTIKSPSLSSKSIKFTKLQTAKDPSEANASQVKKGAASIQMVSKRP